MPAWAVDLCPLLAKGGLPGRGELGLLPTVGDALNGSARRWGGAGQLIQGLAGGDGPERMMARQVCVAAGDFAPYRILHVSVGKSVLSRTVD